MLASVLGWHVLPKGEALGDAHPSSSFCSGPAAVPKSQKRSRWPRKGRPPRHVARKGGTQARTRRHRPTGCCVFVRLHGPALWELRHGSRPSRAHPRDRKGSDSRGLQLDSSRAQGWGWEVMSPPLPGHEAPLPRPEE